MSLQTNFKRQNMIKVALLLFALFLFVRQAGSQQPAADTIPQLTDTLSVSQSNICGSHRFKASQLIIPAALLTVGFIGLESDWLKYQSTEMRDELQENISKHFTVDDIAQYTPIAAVYGLNLCGLKGKHRFGERTIILASSYIIMSLAVNTLKWSTQVQRPDGSSKNSFPSGHTATAFMGAEFLWQEYRDVSPWIGIAGYTVAAGTGFFRMYNNRHWFTDVVAGAGIGMLSTKAAYWLYPVVSKALFPKKVLNHVSLMPSITPESKGFYCQIRF